jgi:hypothetical protein
MSPNHGHGNGWTNAAHIDGKVIKLNDIAAIRRLIPRVGGTGKMSLRIFRVGG